MPSPSSITRNGSFQTEPFQQEFKPPLMRMLCYTCGTRLPGKANYCPQCGQQVKRATETAPSSGATEGQGPNLKVFLLTLVGSLAVSAVLMLLLDWPIFFLTGILPVFWLGRRSYSHS